MLQIQHAHSRRLSWRPRRAFTTLLTRYTRLASRGDASRLAGWMAAAALSLALVTVAAYPRFTDPQQSALTLPTTTPSTAPAQPNARVIDPVCGRTLDTQRAVGFCRIEGQTFWFDRPSCQHAFTTEPLKYVQLRVVVRMAPNVTVTHAPSRPARRPAAQRTTPTIASPSTSDDAPPTAADAPIAQADEPPAYPDTPNRRASRTAAAPNRGPLEAAPSVYEPFPTSSTEPEELEEVPAPVMDMPSGMRTYR